MRKLRVLIVDDEPLAREGIRQLLHAEPDIEICGECSDGVAAIQEIERQKPDLVFLDIQMPEVGGFDVIESLEPQSVPAVIFVTAYDQYALRAFDVHAVDYVLKPVDAARFRAALERARSQITTLQQEQLAKNLSALIEEAKERRARAKRFITRSVGRIRIVNPADIDWIGAEGDYACLYAQGSKNLIRETMNNLERQLDPQRFVRIHRSTIANIDRIKELQPLAHGDCLVLLHDGTRLTMSRTYRDKLEQVLRAPR